jgi:hypothetical protein
MGKPSQCFLGALTFSIVDLVANAFRNIATIFAYFPLPTTTYTFCAAD